MQDNDRVGKLERDVGGLRRDVDVVMESQQRHEEAVVKIDQRLEKFWKVRSVDKEAATKDNDRRQREVMGGLKKVEAEVRSNREFIIKEKAVREFVKGGGGNPGAGDPFLSPEVRQRVKVGAVGAGGLSLLGFLVWAIEKLSSISEALQALIQ